MIKPIRSHPTSPDKEKEIITADDTERTEF